MSNPNNQFAPFFMRYNQQTNAQGLDISTFSLTVRFSYRLNPQTSPLDFYRTFVFFANATYANEDGTQRLENLLPAENYTYPAKNLPLTVSLSIFKEQAVIASELNVLPEEVAIILPINENEAKNFEEAAEMQADNFARIATEKRAYARKLGVDAQAGLSKVCYID